jgi:hypothetical protein
MQLSSDAKGAPDNYQLSSSTIECRRRISAIRIAVRTTGEVRLGALTQLEPGTLLELCGAGYNDRTIKVRWSQEVFYVFRDDLDLRELPGTE